MTPYFAQKPLTALKSAVTHARPSASVVADARSTPLPPAQQQPAPPQKTHLVEHALVQHALTALRNKNTAPQQFRQLSHQLLILLMIEATRGLPFREHTVETTAGPHAGRALARPVILLTIARHGLGLAHNVADLFPNLLVGVISMDRSDDGRAVEPRLHIANAPALSDASVILFDPVVASGASALAALSLVRRSGATDVSFVSFLFSLPGLSRLQSSFPDVRVCTAAIDTELDLKRGPLPGLGNFAERFYG